MLKIIFKNEILHVLKNAPEFLSASSFAEWCNAHKRPSLFQTLDKPATIDVSKSCSPRTSTFRIRRNSLELAATLNMLRWERVGEALQHTTISEMW